MNNKKKTLLIGASENLERYSSKAIRLFLELGYEVVAIGGKPGKVASVSFDEKKQFFSDIDTVTIYLNPLRQGTYLDYIVSLNPKRVIFNPGAENPQLEKIIRQKGIEVLEACTLVLLRTGQY